MQKCLYDNSMAGTNIRLFVLTLVLSHFQGHSKQLLNEYQVSSRTSLAKKQDKHFWEKLIEKEKMERKY
jgi:hypothetical protein